MYNITLRWRYEEGETNIILPLDLMSAFIRTLNLADIEWIKILPKEDLL